jgi:hypothetical protein
MSIEKQLKDHWNEVRSGIINLWGQLNEEELDNVKGDINEIISMVQERSRETKREIYKKLTLLMKSFENDTDRKIDPDVSSYHRSPNE